MAYLKPVPLKDYENHPYWDAADRHELELQKCDSCKEFIHPPTVGCPSCGSGDTIWEKLGSDIKGTVYTYIVSYRPFMFGFHEELPTIIAQVQLDKEPSVKIIANILNCKPEEVKIGMPVRMTWLDITEGRSLPQWEPIE